jgi:hypothetical protein
MLFSRFLNRVSRQYSATMFVAVVPVLFTRRARMGRNVPAGTDENVTALLRLPIPMKPPHCSEMIAPPDSGMISPPVSGVCRQ